jgi:hypothetical protein
MITFVNRSRVALAGLAVALTASCTRPAGQDLLDHSVPNPVPTNPADLESQLTRYIGQTEFANIGYNYRNSLEGGSPADNRSMAAGAQRAVQESDIFKVGNPGSKLLFVLNNYRGLQVISFVDGADRPKLIGRVAATGNYPDDMYYDAANSRLIVLEREWYNQSGGWNQSQTSRILVYSVSEPTNPTLVQELKVEGELADSRIVGETLYVATSVWPAWWDNSSDRMGKGQIYSFQLGADQVTAVATQALNLPVSARENMNIVEVVEGERYFYYVVATLSQTGWGWWDRQSAIEVVDISSTAGEIRPLVVAAAKGQIEERSSTLIKNNTLIAVSQYNVAGDDWRGTRRVAVETFNLPTEASEILSETEAAFRKMWIERERTRIPDGLSEEQHLHNLINDQNLGIAGRFVRKTNGSLEKLIADHTVTTGDTTGLSADVQDVRFDGNLLYVFWVPANMVDPLDVFDISNPQAGARFLKRELFEGWIERSVPVTYQGRSFILGLGWLIPAENNENQRRAPQAMLFEITPRGQSVAIDTVAQITLSSANSWAEFNGQDKNVEVRFNGDGTGAFLFEISGWTQAGGYTSGGKLLGFDLNAAIAGNVDQIFREGALLSANSDWLRRVFTNPEIEKINTLSDRTLGVFDATTRAVGAADATLNAIATLELARDIRGYETIGDQGLQIVDNGTEGTELRLVHIAKADSELVDAKGRLTLEGNYGSHLVDASASRIFIVASTNANTTDDEGNVTYETTQLLHIVSLNNGQLELVKTLNWTLEYPRWGFRPFDRAGMWWPYYGHNVELAQIAGDILLVSSNGKLRSINLGVDEIAAVEVDAKALCGIDGDTQIGLKLIGSQAFLTLSQGIEHNRYSSLMFVKNFVSELALSEERNLVCGQLTNIPGSLLQSGTHIVTDDERVLDIRSNTYTYTGTNGETLTHTYYSPVTARVLASVGQGAVVGLRDMYDATEIRSNVFAPVACKFLFTEKASENYSQNFLSTLFVNDQAQFEKITAAIDVEGEATLGLMAVLPTLDGSVLAVVNANRMAQVLKVELGQRPIALQVKPAGSEIATTEFRLNGWYGWYGSESGKVSFNSALNSLQIAEGLFGVSQLFIVTE